jgi:hypothetical protein
MDTCQSVYGNQKPGYKAFGELSDQKNQTKVMLFNILF